MKELFFAPDTINISMEQDNIARETETSTYNLEDITSQQIILLKNEQNLQTIMEIERRNDPYQGRVNGKAAIPMLPLYLYYDETPFSSFIMKEDLTSLCEHYRIAIIVGMKAFRNFFNQMDTLLPSLILGDNDQVLSRELQHIGKEKSIILSKIIEDVALYYEQEKINIKKRIAYLISVIGDYKIIRENGSVYLAALHSRNAGRAVCDIKIFHLRGRVYPLPVQHSVDNILVGVSDAVMDGNGLSL